MTTEWIVIANAASARIFQRDSAKASLKPVAVLAHERSRLPGRALESDRSGSHAADHGRSLNRFEPRTDVRRKKRISFAREVAEKLGEGLKADAFASLTLVAGVPFMGALNAELSEAVAARVHARLTSDLCHVGLAELESRISGAWSAER